MKLTEVYKLLNNVEVLKDGEFSSLGLSVSKCNEKLLSFIENEKYIQGLGENITCVITTAEIGKNISSKYGILVSENPRMDYFKLHNKLSSNEAYISRTYETNIGEGCNISSTAVISEKNVTIGNNVKIEDYVVIKENTIIGDNCIIRSGCILGGEGFEFKRIDGIIMNVIHLGGVVIENNVEVQCNSCIDKALYPWDNTIVAQHTKIDNMVHLEHGAKIGERCLIASRTTVGGRSEIGNDSWIGLGAIISNGLILGNNISVSLGAVVTKNLSDGEKVSGNFAINHNKFIEFIKKIR